jgi:hypothetical protein
MWHYYAHIQVGEAILKWNGIHANMNMPLLLGNAVRKGKASQREPRHGVQTSQSPHRNQMLVRDRKQNSSKPQSRNRNQRQIKLPTRDHRHLLATLNTMKKNENETMDEFNKRFNELVSSMHQDIKPSESAILIYYIEAFGGEMRYQLRDKEPIDLKRAQETAIKIDKNMQASEKSNLQGFTRGSSSKQLDPKEKEIVPDNKDPSYDPLKAIT